MYYCPLCKKSLFNQFDKKNLLKCTNHECDLFDEKFPIINKTPVLIPFGEEDCIFKKPNSKNIVNLGSKRRNVYSKKKSISKFLKKIIIGENRKSIKNYNYLSNLIYEDYKILIIGGGSIGTGSEKFYEKCNLDNINVESIDVYYSENITAIADAHYLPFKSNNFNLVIIQAVIEHVLNPKRVVSEIYRVLKDNGLVYSETPFLQAVHEGAFDFTRYTHSGHRYLFKDFEEIDSGSIHGAFSSTLFITSYAISGLLRNKIFGIILRLFLSRISTFIDYLVPEKWNIDIACGCFFIGKKTKKSKIKKDSKWITDYYKGAQRK